MNSNNEICIQCGKNPRFKYRGKTYNLCAVCGWKALQVVLGLPDDTNKTPEEKVTEAIDYVPFVKNGVNDGNNSNQD